jgi:hypothetical protein
MGEDSGKELVKRSQSEPKVEPESSGASIAKGDFGDETKGG